MGLRLRRGPMLVPFLRLAVLQAFAAKIRGPLLLQLLVPFPHCFCCFLLLGPWTKKSCMLCIGPRLLVHPLHLLVLPHPPLVSVSKHFYSFPGRWPYWRNWTEPRGRLWTTWHGLLFRCKVTSLSVAVCKVTWLHLDGFFFVFHFDDCRRPGRCDFSSFFSSPFSRWRLGSRETGAIASWDFSRWHDNQTNHDKTRLSRSELKDMAPHD